MRTTTVDDLAASISAADAGAPIVLIDVREQNEWGREVTR